MGNVTIDTAYLLGGLKGQVNIDELRAILKGCIGLHIFQLPKQLGLIIAWALAQVENMVEDVREMGDEAQYGSAKKDAVIKFFDTVIKLPFWLEPIDGPIIGLAVDAIIVALNLFLGKEWRKKITAPAVVPTQG
ncbi:MAG: hypothetical protein WC455_12275 [Dehalococcoidia bacterium]|jgi:hypothetical protein